MRARGISCPVCEGQLAEIREARPDPDHPSGIPRRWRVVVCGDCGIRYPTEERLAPPEAWERIRELGRERMRLTRAG